MKLDVRKLKAVIDTLLTHLIETRGVETVELGDLYWEVPEAQRYDMNAEPAALALEVGNLADDWEMIEAYCEKGSQPVVYSLTEAAPLLRAVGEVAAQLVAKDGG